MIIIVKFSNLSISIFDSIYITKIVFVDSEAILKAWIIDMTILTIVSNIVVFEEIVHMMVVSEMAIFRTALSESVIVNS